MNEKLKNWYRKTAVLLLICSVGMYFTAHAQQSSSYFVYVQSKNGAPFYVKMNDSLYSSTNAGYLILTQLQKGTYPVIIGFAKKKIAESAFKIQVGTSGDEGFLLQEHGNSLQLVNLKSKQVIMPGDVATSAGNRIVGEAASASPVIEKESSPESTSVTNTPEEAVVNSKESKDESSDKKDNPFEQMLNKVAGGGKPVATKTKAEPKQEEGNPPAEDNTEVVDKKSSHKGLDFSDLLKSDKKKPATPPIAKNSETPKPEPTSLPEKSESTSKGLTFIDFDTATTEQPKESIATENNVESNNDTVVTSAKELREQEKALRRREKQKEKAGKKSLFETLLEKDTTSVPVNQSPSIAKPLFGSASGTSDKLQADTPQDRLSNQQMSENGSSACSQVADESYYKKVRRKIASKKSDASMLHTTKKYFDDVCYTTTQVKELAYLFSSDESRFQFLKMAYLHVSDRENYNSLVKTLSSSYYQKRLQAFIK